MFCKIKLKLKKIKQKKKLEKKRFLVWSRVAVFYTDMQSRTIHYLQYHTKSGLKVNKKRGPKKEKMPKKIAKQNSEKIHWTGQAKVKQALKQIFT